MEKAETPKKFWNRDFILYVISFDMAEIATAFLRFAIPVYILTQTGNATLLGTVMTLSWFPFVLFTSVGGVLADRMNKRRIITIFNFLIALLIGIYTIFSGIFDHFSLTVSLLFLMTSLQSLQSPAFETIVYQLIPMEQLMKANQVTWVLMIASGVLAPMLAGLMLAHLGLTSLMIASSLLFLLAAGLNSQLKISFKKTKQEQGIFRTSWADFKSSLRYIGREDEVLKRSTIGLFLYALLLFPILTLLPAVLIHQRLLMGEASVGFAQGFIMIGGVLGVLLISKIGKQVTIQKSATLLTVSSILMLLTLVLFGLTEHRGLAYGILLVGSLLVNTTLVIYSLNYFTYLGHRTDEQMVGKIMAFAITVMMLGGTLSQFALGRFFEIFSENLALAGVILPFVVLLFSFTIRIKTK
ncbi:MAG: MFS transporter [Streptococcaceae bacterium]|nr:MFS transporter [Streptococcaceae bacterium]